MPRIPENKRASILNDLRNETGSVRSIAAQHNVSPSSVSNIARHHGCTPAARAKTKNATMALSADYAALRAQLKIDLAQDATRIRRRFWAKCTVFKFGGKDNTLNSIDLDEPDFEGQQRIATTVGILTDKLAVLERMEAEADRGAVAGGLLEQIAVGLLDARATRMAAEQTALGTKG